MVNIIELKTSIYNQIKDITDTYENGRVPKKVTMPYITYDLTTSTEDAIDNVDSVDFVLEITILDHNGEKDTTTVEQLVNQVDTVLNRKNTIEGNFYWFAIRQTVIPDLPTPDEFTFRREIQCLIKTYISEVN